MNDVFLALPIKKQERIINAALEIFSKNDYKKANTDDIAAIAGISKGALFYYFKNKESLFLYLFDYVTELTHQYIKDDDYLEITDFFEIMEHGAKSKIILLAKNPYILDFIMNCYFQDNSPVSEKIRDSINDVIAGVYTTYFSHIDTFKFKDGIRFEDVYEILLYATEGYVLSARNTRQKLAIDLMMKEFYKWIHLFKTMVYKEEYLDE